MFESPSAGGLKDELRPCAALCPRASGCKGCLPSSLSCPPGPVPAAPSLECLGFDALLLLIPGYAMEARAKPAKLNADARVADVSRLLSLQGVLPSAGALVQAHLQTHEADSSLLHLPRLRPLAQVLGLQGDVLLQRALCRTVLASSSAGLLSCGPSAAASEMIDTCTREPACRQRHPPLCSMGRYLPTSQILP